MRPRSAFRFLRQPRRLFSAALLALGMVLAAAAPAPAAEVKVESPSFQFDSAAGVYRYQDAKLQFAGASLEAQEVVLSPETGQVRASGQVRLRLGTVFVAAEQGEFNAETGEGTLRNAKLYDSKTGYFLTAETLRRKADGNFAAERCSLTACPPFVPGWKISASDVVYGVDSFATGTNARLELGGVPVFWFPVLAWPTVSKRQSGLLQPEYTWEFSTLQRFNLGSRLRVPYFGAFGPDHDLTVLPEYIELRGNALGLEYKYAFTEGQAGKLRLWGIEESFRRTPALENDILPAGGADAAGPSFQRYTADWLHNARIGETGRLIMSAASSSDGQVRREYTQQQNHRPEMSYQVALSRQTGWGDIALTAEHVSEFAFESIYARGAQFADGRDRPALRPLASYQGGFRPWAALPLGFQFTAQAAQFHTANGVSGGGSVARPTVALPISLGEGVELRLSGGREIVTYSGLSAAATYGGSVDPSQGYSRGEGQLELRADLARVYNQDSGPWTAIKHRITPRLVVDVSEDVAQPLADLVFRAVPARSLATLRLDNTWLGRAGETPAAELGHFNITQRYNFLREDLAFVPVGPALPAAQETGPGQPLLPLIFQGDLSAKSVQVGFEAHYHHQLGRFTESTVFARGATHANRRLGISLTQNEFTYWTPQNQLRPQATSFAFTGEVALADTLSLGLDGSLNLRNDPAPLDRRLERSALFVDFHPICYRIRVSYEESLEVTQVEGRDQYFVNRRFGIAFDLGGLLGASRQLAVLPGGGR